MTSGFRQILLAIVTGVAILIGVHDLNAQGARGSLGGTVTDMSGSAVPEATVQVKNLGTGVTQTVTSDAAGRFSALDLAVGEYDAQASKMGFSTVVRKGIVLTVGAQIVIDFAMPVGQQQQTVTVEGQTSQVETTNASVGALVDQTQMRELPLNGRNFEQLILLAPGVQSYTAIQADSFAGRAPSYSVAGARPEGQAILLDDENMQSFWNKGIGSIAGTSLGVEAIAEFQTLTNTYSAQYGGNGAVVNSVSKSGTNSFHGSAFDFLRNSVLDARNFFDPRNIPAFRKNQFGGSVGGPIKKDKAFFFVNYEGIRQLFGETKIAFVPDAAHRSPASTVTDPVIAQAITNTLALYPLPDAGTVNAATGIGTSVQGANQIAHENYVLGRFDQNLSEKDALFVRYLSDKDYFIEPFAGGGVGGQLSLWPEQDSSHSQFATASWRRIISPTLVNVARVSFSRPGIAAQTTASATVNGTQPLQLFPGSGRQDAQVTITGLSGLGGHTFTPFNTTQNRYTEADDLSWTHGGHTVKFGASVSRLQSNTYFPQRAFGVWAFQSLANFQQDIALTLTGAPLKPGQYANRDFRQIEFTPYIQDDWKISSKLTLNLGVRWAFVTNPVEAHGILNAITDIRNAIGYSPVPNVLRNNPSWASFDPRIGFAYDLFADHKTSIRGGAGMFHDPILPPVYAAYYWSAPPWGASQQASPVFPFPFGPNTPTLLSAASGFDYNTSVTPYMLQYNLNVQRQLSEGTVLSVGYVGSHGVHLLSQIEQNPPVANIDSAGVYHFGSLNSAAKIVGNPRINPNLSTFTDISPISSSRYNSMQASLNRRLTRHVQTQIAYTWSNCIDNGATLSSLNSNTPGTVENPYDQHVDKGPCGFDVRHTLRVNGLVTLPFKGNRFVEGWQLSGIASANTGLPFNISTGFDSVGYASSGSPRPNYVSGCDPRSGNYSWLGGQYAAQTPSSWFNPNCFSVAPPGTLGDLGRNSGIGPSIFDLDLAIAKDTRITENTRLQFRAEFFNILNHPNFALPSAAVFVAGPAGACTVSGSGCGSGNIQAGRITATAGTSRQIQFGLKFLF